MRLRTPVALALAALALAAPGAAAQDATPVVGGGSFNAAPILEPGRYRDTVLPEEFLYYGVRVEAGQRLHVTANSEMTGDDFSSLGISFVTVGVHSPDRSKLLDVSGDSTFGGSEGEGADLTTDVAAGVAEETESGADKWQGPGVYYVSAFAAYSGGSDEPPKAEIPFEFELQVEGVAQTEPAATPTPTPTASATREPASSPEADEDGPAPAVAAGAGVGGLLLGVIGGIVLRQRRR
jgi:hypothetical protein